MKIYKTIPIYINTKCKIHEVLNFYLNNPPVKLDLSIPANLLSYTNILNRSKKLTLIEISEYEPIYSEIVIETGKTDTILSIKEIHDKIMNIYIFSDIDNLQNINFIYSRIVNLLSRDSLAENLIEKVIAHEIINIYNKYFGMIRDKILYENEFIKVEPNKKYYVLFTRYIGDCELNNKLFNVFNRVFEINLILNLYNSHLFMSSDYSIRNVSISGLSVTFNTPEAESLVNRLLDIKRSILENMLVEDLPERF